MGRGDKKTAKGKRFKGSFGKSRPASPKKKTAVKKKS
ncbi:MAG: 30S ribosomal protein THX [Chitinophagaceae bacterium]